MAIYMAIYIYGYIYGYIYALSTDTYIVFRTLFNGEGFMVMEVDLEHVFSWPVSALKHSLKGSKQKPPRLKYNASPQVYRSKHELPLLTGFLNTYRPWFYLP